MNQAKFVAIGGLVALLLVIGGIVYVIQKSNPRPTAATSAQTCKSTAVKNPTATTIPTTQAASDPQLQSTDLVLGCGTEATKGKTLSVSYTGTLADGTVFDSTAKDGGHPFSFTLGAGQVIPGWDYGVAGMKVGGERKLVIPAALGYGSQAAGSIPPNSTLNFDIKLLSVQ